MSEPNIGQLLTGNEHRDAIHFALAPVMAGEDLKPGEHVGMLPSGRVGKVKEPIGIIDPFLKKKVFAGERCYLFLYVKTVTGMRHEWTHPAFPEPAPNTPELSISPSQVWIENYAESIGLTYDVLMDGARNYIDSSNHLVFGGLLEGVHVPDEFWDHYEKITGKRGKGSFFSCSC